MNKPLKCCQLPLISPEYWSVDTSLCENVDVAENTRKVGVSLVPTAKGCWQPRLTAVLKQHTKHSTLGLGQLHQLSGNLQNSHRTPACLHRLHKVYVKNENQHTHPAEIDKLFFFVSSPVSWLL